MRQAAFDSECAFMREHISQRLESARRASHDPVRIGLIDRKKRHKRVAHRARPNNLVGAHDCEWDRARTDHFNRGNAEAACADRHIESMPAVNSGKLRSEKSTKLRFRFPVELELDSGRRLVIRRTPSIAASRAQERDENCNEGSAATPPQPRRGGCAINRML